MEVPGLPRISAHVIINGQVAKEYAPPEFLEEEANLPTRIRYIESQSGQTYTVRVKLDDRKAPLQFPDFKFSINLYVDGEHIEGHFLTRHESRYEFVGPCHRTSVPEQLMRQKLVFAPISAGTGCAFLTAPK